MVCESERRLLEWPSFAQKTSEKRILARSSLRPQKPPYSKFYRNRFCRLRDLKTYIHTWFGYLI